MQKDNPQIAEDLKGWKLKSKSSTMFPDDWTQADIELNISQAWKNGVAKEFVGTKKEGWYGYTDDGIRLQFATENHPPSVFANFDY